MESRMRATRPASLAAIAVAVAIATLASFTLTRPALGATIDRSTPDSLVASLQEAIKAASLDHYATLFHPGDRADARWSQPPTDLTIEVARKSVRGDWAAIDLKTNRDDWRTDLFAIKVAADPTRLIEAGWYVSFGQGNRPPRWARDVIADYRSDRLRADGSIPRLRLSGTERVELKPNEHTVYCLLIDEARYVAVDIALPAAAQDFTITLTDAAGSMAGVLSIEDRDVRFEDVLRPNAYLLTLTCTSTQTVKIKTSNRDADSLPSHWIEWDTKALSGTIKVKANTRGSVLQPRRPVRLKIHKAGDYVFAVRPPRDARNVSRAPMIAVEHPGSAVYDEGAGSYMTIVRDIDPGMHTILVSNWDMIETSFELEAVHVPDGYARGDKVDFGSQLPARRLTPGTLMMTSFEVTEEMEVAFYARAVGEGADFIAFVAKLGDPTFNDRLLLGRGFDMLAPGKYVMFMYGFERSDDIIVVAYTMPPLKAGDAVSAPVSVTSEHYQVVAAQRDVRVTITGSVKAKPGAREADSHFAFLALTLELAQVASVVAELGDEVSLTFQVPRGARVYIQVLCNKVSAAQVDYKVQFGVPQQEPIPSGAMRSALNGSPTDFQIDAGNTQREVWFELNDMAYVELLVERDSEGSPLPVRIEKYGVPVAADLIYIFVVRYMVLLEPGTYRLVVGAEGVAPTQTHQVTAMVHTVNVITSPHEAAMTLAGGVTQRRVIHVEEAGKYSLAYEGADQQVEIYVSTYPFDSALAASRDESQMSVYLDRGFYYVTVRNHDDETARGTLQVKPD